MMITQPEPYHLGVQHVFFRFGHSSQVSPPCRLAVGEAGCDEETRAQAQFQSCAKRRVTKYGSPRTVQKPL